MGITLVVFAIAALAAYALIRAAVRDGVVQAINKTGVGSSSGGSTFIHGYPPVQDLGAPLPPSRTGG